MRNFAPHFLPFNLNKLVFHKNHNFIFFKYLDTHANNTLFIDDMPHKNSLTKPFSAIFVELFNGFGRVLKYLL